MKSVLTYLTLSLVALAALHAAEPAAIPHAFEKDIEAFKAGDKKSPPKANAILFVGDSTFTRWTTIHDDLPGYTVINRGFGGSTLADLLYFFDRVVVPYKPRMIVVQEGGNDIHGGRTPEQFLADVKAFMAKVRAAMPDVPIVFGGIASNSARWSEAETRRQANKLVKEYLATEKNVVFVDFFDALLGPDGKPNDDLVIADHMHPSPAGYQLRVKLIKPFLGEQDVKK